MRTMFKLPLVLALVAVPVIALARPGMSHQDKLATFDKDGNGTLDATEREAMIAARKDAQAKRHAAMLAEFDKNKDGTLDATERAAKKEAMIDRMFTRLDVDKDGSISRAELAQGMPAFRGGRGGGPGAHRGHGRGGMHAGGMRGGGSAGAQGAVDDDGDE